MRKKILLSGFIILTLLVSGCSESEDSTVKSDTTIDNPIEQPIAIDPYKTAGWYGKTVVHATAEDGKVYSHKSAGVFGELVQSSDDKDQHDIPGYGPAKLQIVFYKPEWGDNNGYYFSDYRSYDDNSKQVWTFQVLNTYVEKNPDYSVDLSHAFVTISLPAIYDVRYKEDNGGITYKESSESNITLLNRLTLVDVDNNTAYSVSELQTASLNMDGKYTRTFRWVLGTVDQDDYTPLAAPQRASGRNSAITAFDVELIQQNSGNFGLPPR